MVFCGRQQMMKSFFVMAVIMLGLGFVAVFFPVHVGNASRGDAPRCQQECLRKHQAEMERLAKEYAGERNKMEFQNRVDDAVKDYWMCTENCREVQPVK
jgi:hypothetical protein